MSLRRFGPETRLRRRVEYERVRETGLRHQDRWFLLQVAPVSEGRLQPRLGVIATRRLGNAVVRNRAKRVFRALFRTTISRIPPTWDLVVIPRRGFLEAAHSQLLEAWLQGLQRIERRQPRP